MSNEELRRKVGEHDWYHTIELAPGVVTPGWFDLRDVVTPDPDPRIAGRARALDVGTFDGFWAFEMERRGASEVIAIDVLDPAAWDWPAGSEPAAMREIGKRKAGGAGFLLAQRALGSGVRRLERSGVRPRSAGDRIVRLRLRRQPPAAPARPGAARWSGCATWPMARW